MRKLGLTAVTVGLLLACSGCASTDAGSATPTPTPDPNTAACQAFTEATQTMAASWKGTYPDDSWPDVRVAFDQAALGAAGDVKTRLQALVDDWPDITEMVTGDGSTTISTHVSDIARACDASGHDISQVMNFTE